MHQGAMVENRKKHRQNSHLIIDCPTSEGVSKVSGASERANGRASGPVLQSVFLAVIVHSGRVESCGRKKWGGRGGGWICIDHRYMEDFLDVLA